jgi:hypothetical protein
MDLPVYEFLIDDDIESGVKAVSLVGQPAMKSSFIAFDNVNKKPKYIALKSDYKQVVLGVVMQPDLPIYRVDEETKEEYYGVFSKETIEKIVHKFHKEQVFTDDVNLQHDDKQKISAYMFMDYIVDSELQVEDLNAKGISDVKLGSWIAAYKIEDKEVFEKALNGEVTGFSIEAFLNRELFKAMEIKNNNNNFKEVKKMKKTIIEKLTEKLNKIVKEISFEEALVPELNVTLTWGEVGEVVTKTYMDESDVEVVEPVGEGEFVIEDGRTIVTDANSALVEIRDAVEAPVEEEEETEVKAVEEKSGESTVSYTEVGQPVTVDGEPAAEGEIALDNGVVLVVDASGNLAEIKEAPAAEEAQELAEETPAETTDIKAQLDAIFGQYGDGEFSLMVTKTGGEYKWGVVSMWKDIKMASASNA